MRLQPLPFTLLAALAAAGLPGCSSTDAPGQPAPSFTVKVIGFNDYHGHLQSPGTFGVNAAVPAASRPAVGGADVLAAYVARMKAANPLNVVVGAGDFIGASPLVSALFHDEPAVANAAGEMPVGDLIADAQLAVTQPAAQGGAEIAFMNPGGVRSPGFDIPGATYPYAVSYGDAFTMRPSGNTLMTLNLTAQQLKNLLGWLA